MDARRYVTETKSAIVQFLSGYLNSEAYADLWANVGGGVTVVAKRPNWVVQAELSAPLVVVSKGSGETDFTVTTHSQYLVEGYRKRLIFDISCCADESTGGRITADDLASSIEHIMLNNGVDLQEQGVLLIELTDSSETDEKAQYQNQAALLVDVIVPGAQITPLRIELARFRLTAAGQGAFYPGTALDPAMAIEAELISATSGTDVTAVVHAVDEDSHVVDLGLYIPRATSAGTRIALTGGTPGAVYKSVASISVTGGQAGYIFAVITKTGE